MQQAAIQAQQLNIRMDVPDQGRLVFVSLVYKFMVEGEEVWGEVYIVVHLYKHQFTYKSRPEWGNPVQTLQAFQVDYGHQHTRQGIWGVKMDIFLCILGNGHY